jgi:hypothetical protein
VLKTVFLGAIATLIPLAAHALPAFDVLGGQALLQRYNQTYTAIRGVKLIEGDTLVVRSQIQFLGDFGAFVATAKSGFYQLTLLRRESGCIRNVISYRGSINITPRPLLCDRSILQIISLNSGGSYTFRGTNAWIEDEEKATKLIVEHGRVEASAQGVTVAVPTGYGNITREGEPPGAAIALDNDLNLRDLKIVRSALGVEISAKINPLNQCLVQGVPIGASRGEPKAHLEFPISGNALNIEVRNPQGKRRVYSYPLPTRK